MVVDKALYKASNGAYKLRGNKMNHPKLATQQVCSERIDVIPGSSWHGEVQVHGYFCGKTRKFEEQVIRMSDELYSNGCRLIRWAESMTGLRRDLARAYVRQRLWIMEKDVDDLYGLVYTSNLVEFVPGSCSNCDIRHAFLSKCWVLSDRIGNEVGAWMFKDEIAAVQINANA